MGVCRERYDRSGAGTVIQMTLVDTGMITWRDVARILSEEPAKIGRLDHEQGPPAGRR